MTASQLTRTSGIGADWRPGMRAWLAAVLLLGGLVGIVVVRWVATRAGLDPLAVGTAFGVAMLGLAGAGASASASATADAGADHRTWGWPRIRVRPAAWSIAIGVAFGVGLVAIAALGAALAGSPAAQGIGRPAAPFAPWAAITVLVAAAEEALLRSALFARVERVGGPLLALLVTSAAFALMHVPSYGWHVVPLDLAVGLVLGGLRIATARVAGAAVAHASADLATWWL